MGGTGRKTDRRLTSEVSVREGNGPRRWPAEKATHEEATMEQDFHSIVNDQGYRHGHAAQQEIGHSQGRYKVEGGLSKTLTRPYCPDHQHITNTTKNCNQDFQHSIGYLVTDILRSTAIIL